MKRHALLFSAVAIALLATSCSAQSSTAPAPATETPSVSAPAGSTDGSSIQSSAPSPDSGSSIVSPNSGSSISSNTQSVPSSDAPKGNPGVATDAQMTVIDKVARAIANGKYDDAASAGYYTFDSSGYLTQDAAKMSSLREKHADYFDTAKDAFSKGCQLVPVSVNSSGVIYINMSCKDGSTPNVSIHAQYMGGKLAYLDATYAGDS